MTTTADDIARRLASLREAGADLRRRPAGDVLDALAAVLERWRDPDSGTRRRLAGALPGATGFSRETVALGLEHGLSSWSGEALRELVDRELGGPGCLDAAGPRLVSGFPTTAVVLAGSIPMPSLLGLIAPLVLRSPVLAKVASRDPVTPLEVAASIAEIDPELGRCIGIVDFPGDDAARSRALLEADCVVASGSDATLAAIAARVAPPRRLVAYGHRVSVAAIGPDAGEDVAERLALDVALWDQQGCLSPVAVYVVGADSDAVDRTAADLDRALSALALRAPRGEIAAGAAAAFTAECDAAALRAADGQGVAVHRGASHAVVRESGPELRPAPLHRFVRVHPVASTQALVAALRPLAPHLAAVALEGLDAAGGELTRALADLGASRLCRPGAMQRPPLGWRHDGLGTLLPLARFADAEINTTY